MIAPALIDPIVDLALREDLEGGDITTDATVEARTVAVGRAIAKAEIVVCGGEVFAATFRRVDPSLETMLLAADGSVAKPGDVLWTVTGSARSILKGERTALNFVQRLCGIATLAHRYVAALPSGSKSRITDTRKTTPGLRMLERYAVRVGGAHNHRDSLASAVLIKDNHIAAAGGIRAAIERARRFAPHTSRLEIEVESLAALEEALDAGADIVMLDNFAGADIIEAVKRARSRALVEVSGGVTLDRIAELSQSGVDVISVGALTHSAPAADISLDIERI